MPNQPNAVVNSMVDSTPYVGVRTVVLRKSFMQFSAGTPIYKVIESADAGQLTEKVPTDYLTVLRARSREGAWPNRRERRRRAALSAQVIQNMKQANTNQV